MRHQHHEQGRKKLSFCITSKGRTAQLKETLRRNLDDNRAFQDVVEFVLLDGNHDNLDLQRWILDCFRDDLDSGYLRYAWTDALVHWHASWAKNTAYASATGDILVNLDGDNYVGENGARYVLQFFETGERIVLHQNTVSGTFGRIGCRRRDFLRVGGYDQSFMPMVYEDADFIDRLKRSGAKYVHGARKEFALAVFNDEEDSLALVDAGQKSKGAPGQAAAAPSPRTLAKQKWTRMHAVNSSASLRRKQTGSFMCNLGQPSIGIHESHMFVYDVVQRRVVPCQSVCPRPPIDVRIHWGHVKTGNFIDLDACVVSHWQSVAGARTFYVADKVRTEQLDDEQSEGANSGRPKVDLSLFLVPLTRFPFSQAKAIASATLNARLKSLVGFLQKEHEHVFQYSLTVPDATEYTGDMMSFSTWRETWDQWGIIKGPLDPLVWQSQRGYSFRDPRKVYYRVPDNSVAGDLFVTHRLFYYKHCGVGEAYELTTTDKDSRFSQPDGSTTKLVTDIHSVLSDAEVRLVLQFCEAIQLDFGSLDCVRDNGDGRIYIIDVNQAPVFLKRSWASAAHREAAMDLQSARFQAFLRWWLVNFESKLTKVEKKT